MPCSFISISILVSNSRYMLQRENKHCILDVWGGEGLILDLKGITNLPDSGPKGVKIKYLHGIL
jgi:hypothetical protein